MMTFKPRKAAGQSDRLVNLMHKNLVFVISAPSGTGKTTIARLLRKQISGLNLVVTYTTKNPRPAERHGIDYQFVSVGKFKKMAAKGEFIEWAEVFGNYYGTPAKPLRENISNGVPSLLTIDTQGGRSIKKAMPDAVLIAVLPPSIAEQERRIRKRNGLSEEEIRGRVEAYRHERSILVSEYDFIIINKNLNRAVEKIRNIIVKGRKK